MRSDFLKKFGNFKDPEEIQRQRIERIKEQNPEYKGKEKLKEKLREISKELLEEGFPVREDARIECSSEFFNDIYTEEEQEKRMRKLEKFEKEIHGEDEEGRMNTAGELLEMRKTTLFNKFLEDSFRVIRTSKYDDYFNHLDNIIMDRETGEMVAAFDEVSALADPDKRNKDPRFREKEEKVFDINASGGGRLDYGFQLLEDEEEKKIIPAKLENIPVFWIPLSGSSVEESVKKFGSEKEEDLEYEKGIFNYLVENLYNQAKNLRTLRKSPSDLEKREKSFLITKDWKKRLDTFYGYLETFIEA